MASIFLAAVVKRITQTALQMQPKFFTITDVDRVISIAVKIFTKHSDQIRDLLNNTPILQRLQHLYCTCFMHLQFFIQHSSILNTARNTHSTNIYTQSSGQSMQLMSECTKTSKATDNVILLCA